MESRELDIILENARVIDGSGAPAFDADVGIKGDAIEKVGNLKGVPAKRKINVDGRTICPGFVDVHSHAELSFFRHDHAQVLLPLVKQGITTFVGGNCGMSLAPITGENRDGLKTFLEIFTQMDFERDVKWDTMGSFMEYLDKEGILLNAALLAPHGLLRISTLGLEAGGADDTSIAAMKWSLEECLEAGVFGLSTGLQYFPCNQSDTRELVRLSEPLRRYGGIFTCHLRSYTSTTLARAIEEVGSVARENRIRAQVSHIFSVPWFGLLHNAGLRVLKWLARHPGFARKIIPRQALYGEMKRIFGVLERERSKGAVLGIDVMPTTAGFTHLLAFFPSWALSGGREKVISRILDPNVRMEILGDIEKGKPKWPHRGKDDWSLNIMRQLGWDAVTIMAVHSEKNKHLEGRNFADLAQEQDKHPFDVMCDLLIEEEGKVLVFESLSEPDDEFTEAYTFPALEHPQAMIVTDTILLGIGKPSYLFYGCYPKFIHRYVFEKKLLDLPEAIRRCTSLPAGWFGIEHRGLVREGFFADLLVMRPENFRTDAVFRDPENSPEGLDMVIINGSIVVEDGKVQKDGLHGRVLRRNSKRLPGI